MNILLIRHGESEADILHVLEGRANFSLTEEGLNQARLLSKWISQNEKMDIVLSSPLKRAKETAEEITKINKTSIIFDEELMEWDNGQLAGLAKSDADIKFPIPPGGKKGHHTAADSESLINLRARAETALSKIIEKYNENSQICIVSHSLFINMFLKALLELPNNMNISFSCSDTCIHKIRLSREKRHVEYLNKTEHLKLFS